jgi:hypothetical protein
MWHLNKINILFKKKSLFYCRSCNSSQFTGPNVLWIQIPNFLDCFINFQCNRPFSTGQLSAFIIQLVTWQVLPCSERKNKISCNKNAIKNTEMLENYIYCIHNKSVSHWIMFDYFFHVWKVKKYFFLFNYVPHLFLLTCVKFHGKKIDKNYIVTNICLPSFYKCD